MNIIQQYIEYNDHQYSLSQESDEHYSVENMVDRLYQQVHTVDETLDTDHDIEHIFYIQFKRIIESMQYTFHYKKNKNIFNKEVITKIYRCPKCDSTFRFEFDANTLIYTIRKKYTHRCSASVLSVDEKIIEVLNDELVIKTSYDDSISHSWKTRYMDDAMLDHEVENSANFQISTPTSYIIVSDDTFIDNRFFLAESNNYQKRVYGVTDDINMLQFTSNIEVDEHSTKDIVLYVTNGQYIIKNFTNNSSKISTIAFSIEPLYLKSKGMS